MDKGTLEVTGEAAPAAPAVAEADPSYKSHLLKGRAARGTIYTGEVIVCCRVEDTQTVRDAVAAAMGDAQREIVETARRCVRSRNGKKWDATDPGFDAWWLGIGPEGQLEVSQIYFRANYDLRARAIFQDTIEVV